LLIPLVEARGVAGAVSGNSGGVIFMGRGKRDARCFRRPKKRPELVLEEVKRGFGVFSNETCPPLPSEREDSEARGGTGNDNVEVPSS
jgi:hypothetical protein